VGLSGDLATLPERLSRAGYRTFGVASNINIGAELGFARGFDEFERLHVADAEELFERLLPWRDELQAAGPSFLYLHLNDVHKPYQRRAPWFEPSEDPLANWIAKYDSEISYLDQALGGLAAELDWGPETVILVVSDHGEEFMDHGDMGHKFSLHYELNRVLMLLHAPRAGEGTEPTAGAAGRGGRSTANVSLVDVMPTLLEVAGLAPDPDAPGRSLLALAAGEDAAYFDERTLFAHRLGGEGEHLWAAIRGDWKVIHEPAAQATSLFDIGRDSAETDDLSGSHAAVAADLESRLERFRAQFPIRTGQVTEVQVDGDLFEHLKRLGYVDGE